MATTGADSTFASIPEIGARFRDGSLSIAMLTERTLRRIRELQPVFNAFITVTGELADEQARGMELELRAKKVRSALHGVPVAVKDFYDTAGIRTTAAFERFRERVPRRDADLVVKLRELGAVLVGKTNMHTLGMGTTSLVSHFGPVLNPRNAAYVAGGSSGGSAVAVATGQCFATVDTDAVGSGRLPAAINGIACFKPSFGVLSTVGILAGEPISDPAIPLLSHACVTARSADDVALTFEALTDSAPTPTLPRRVGIVTNFTGDATINRAFQDAVANVIAMDRVVVDVTVPFERASFNVARIDSDRADAITLFPDVDVLMLPTLAAPTPTIEQATLLGDLAVSPENTFFANYFGLPAITVPAGADDTGLPLGVQFVGPPGKDRVTLSFAREYQRATRWEFERP